MFNHTGSPSRDVLLVGPRFIHQRILPYDITEGDAPLRYQRQRDKFRRSRARAKGTGRIPQQREDNPTNYEASPTGMGV